jgi:leucyl/phenylalanyl-tRNA--protein transferase
MPLHPLTATVSFPDPRRATPSGLLAVGGDLSVERLRAAYRSGIFPWFSEGQPILWWSPDPRMIVPLHELRLSRSLRKTIRKAPYKITVDAAFPAVIAACAAAPRPGQRGTWITRDMQRAYVALHAAGNAHSVEAWDETGALVGGLYGVATGRMFAGESMFARAPDASKVAFALLAIQLRRWGFPAVDCQMHTEHLARFGGREIPRAAFLALLATVVDAPPPPVPWRLDADLADEV